MNEDRCCVSHLIGMPSIKAASVVILKYLLALILTLAATCALTPQTARNRRNVLNHPDKDAAILLLSGDTTSL